MSLLPGPGRRDGSSFPVATVVYSAQALDDIAHALATIRAAGSLLPEGAALAIRTAVEGLAAHPFIGRRIEGDVRELIISFGRTGCVALYRYHVHRDEVRLLALRSQRELCYIP